MCKTRKKTKNRYVGEQNLWQQVPVAVVGQWGEEPTWSRTPGTRWVRWGPAPPPSAPRPAAHRGSLRSHSLSVLRIRIRLKRGRPDTETHGKMRIRTVPEDPNAEPYINTEKLGSSCFTQCGSGSSCFFMRIRISFKYFWKITLP